MLTPAQKLLDPTFEMTRAPRLPMTPEQLDALRPKNQPAATLEADARKLAYKIGLRELEPVIARLILLERTVADQDTKITELQSTVLALKYQRVR